jgi:hypothetical protein
MNYDSDSEFHIPANQWSPARESTLHVNVAASGVQAYSVSTWNLQQQSTI